MRTEKLRNHMVDSQVLPAAVTNRRLLEAMRHVPRELFVPDPYRPLAYTDLHIPLGHHRTLIAPRPLARLLQALNPQPENMTLDVACGSGYSTALLARLVAPGTVVGLESHDPLIQKASDTLAHLEIDNALITSGDLAEGLPQQGPYDLIFLNGALHTTPQNLLQQLTPQGRLVAVMESPGPTRNSTAILFHRRSRTPLFEETLPPLPEFIPDTRFVFE